MNDTTINRRLKLDDEEYQVRRIVNFLYHNVLRDYIGRANERDVIDNLYKFYAESDMILIGKQQLRVYQELEKHSLDLSAFDIKKETL